MISDSPLSRQNERLTLTMARLVAALMALCFGMVCVAFVEWLRPGWQNNGMTLVCAAMIAEASLTTWFLKKRETPATRALAYRLAEWMLLLLLLKIFAEARFGLDRLAENIEFLRGHFWAGLLSENFVAVGMIALAAWQVCALLVGTLTEMEVTYTTFGVETPPPVAPDQRRPFQETLGRHFLLTGGLLALLGGVALQASFSRPALRTELTAILVAYFVLGLILLGLTNFAALVTFWRYNRVRVVPNLAVRWMIYSLLFLALLAGISLWLPSGYKLGLLDTLTILIGYLMALVAGVYYLFLLALSSINRLTARLFGIPNAPAPPPPPAPFEPGQYLEQTGQPIRSGDIVNSLVFWAIFIAILVFAFRQFLTANPHLAAILRRFGLVRFLASVWAWMKTVVEEVSEDASSLVRRGLNHLRQRGRETLERGRQGYVHLRRLPPRQKVLFYYLALVRRAGEAGAPRQDWQTPYEYEHALQPGLQDESESLDGLTEAFVQARYSRIEVTSAEADHSRSAWERLRRALRAWRQSQPPNEKD
jgi:hypothetical protein